MPFADYEDFDECVRKNQDKRDPKAYCAKIHKEATGQWPGEGKSFFTPLIRGKPMMKAVTETNPETDEINYYVEGYVMTHGRDLGGDDITKRCMVDAVRQIKTNGLKIDVEHENIDERVGPNRMHIGKVIPETVTYDGNGVWIRVKIFKDHPMFKTIWSAIKEGVVDAFSIGYQILKDGAFKKTVKGVTTRFLDSIKLLNATLTGLPMQQGAKMTNFFAKALDWMESENYLKDGQHNIKQSNSSTDDIKSEENKMPEENEESNKPDSQEAEKPESNESKDTKEQKSLIAEMKNLTERVEKLESKSEEGEEKKDEPEDKPEAKDIEDLKKKVAELEKILNKPQYKGIQENMNAEVDKNTAVKEITPLEAIGG